MHFGVSRRRCRTNTVLLKGVSLTNDRGCSARELEHARTVNLVERNSETNEILITNLPKIRVPKEHPSGFEPESPVKATDAFTAKL